MQRQCQYVLRWCWICWRFTSPLLSLHLKESVCLPVPNGGMRSSRKRKVDMKLSQDCCNSRASFEMKGQRSGLQDRKSYKKMLMPEWKFVCLSSSISQKLLVDFLVMEWEELMILMILFFQNTWSLSVNRWTDGRTDRTNTEVDLHQ